MLVSETTHMNYSGLVAVVVGSLCLSLAQGCSAGGSNGSSVHGSSNGQGGATNIDINPGGATGGGLNVGANGGDAADARKPLCTTGCTDLPSAPIFDGVDPSVASQFTAAPSGAGPCILEPLDGSMVPYNWTRERVHFTAATGSTVFQITVHADSEANDLVAYTNQTTWVLPVEAWDNHDSTTPKGLTYNIFDTDITVTVRASTGSGAPSESTSKFRIAPVKAGGSMVFWSAAAVKGQNGLYGFSPGDEGIVSVLQPSDVKDPIIGADGTLKQPSDWPTTPTGQVACVGCHSSAPDGAAVATTDRWPWNIVVSSITTGNSGVAPDYVTPMGKLLRQMSWQGATTFSNADWATRRRYVTSFGKRTIDMNQPWVFGCPSGSCSYTGLDDLIWVDLAAAGDAPTTNNDNAYFKAFISEQNIGWGIIPRTGDPRGAVTPDWSHDGTKIAYTSTDSTSDGRIGHSANSATPLTAVDIYTVPFNNGMGGTATPVPGASDPANAEYYPDFSADDVLLAYTRVNSFKSLPTAEQEMYYRPQGEVWVVPATGGTALRLTANDPPACSGEASPGVHNSWPKWSPVVREANGKKYYFLIFSSSRQSPGTISDPTTPTDVNPMSQLYMATLVDDGSGKLEQHSAVFLWNQRNLVTLDASQQAKITDFVENNVTPAWDEFQAPAVPPVVVK
jgi:hypothetical protein